MIVDSEETLIKLSWKETDEGWTATAITATRNELRNHHLHPGCDVEFEFTGDRRCIGYADESGHNVCPEWNRIDTGERCPACRNRDIHLDYVEGRSGSSRDGEHSVYFAQCGDVVKVGVTRSTRLHERWIEQGAAYAVEVMSGLTADEALAVEKRFSDKGLRERIRKSQKLPVPDDEAQLRQAMNDHDVDGDVVSCLSNCQYDPPSCNHLGEKTRRVVGELQSAMGQIMAVDGQCVPISSGYCVQPPKQTGLEEYL